MRYVYGRVKTDFVSLSIVIREGCASEKLTFDDYHIYTCLFQILNLCHSSHIQFDYVYIRLFAFKSITADNTTWGSLNLVDLTASTIGVSTIQVTKSNRVDVCCVT